jgi:hypothetical protein
MRGSNNRLKEFNKRNFMKYYKADEIKRKRCLWHVASMEEVSNAYRILVRKPEVKSPLQRPKHRCKNNIKLNHT